MSEIIQGSPEWFNIRLGKVTASRVSDVIAKTKTGWGASRANYMAELIVERLTGQPPERFTNAAMLWGTEKEPDARAAYEFIFDRDVEQVGFIHHPSIEMSGASPDGLVGADGLIEIKAPNTSTHLETLLRQVVPEKYVTQMYWQMACTGRVWCDYVSFDPRLPSHLQMFTQRIHRDEKKISEMEDLVVEFLKEVDGKVAALDKIYGGRNAEAA